MAYFLRWHCFFNVCFYFYMFLTQNYSGGVGILECTSLDFNWILYDCFWRWNFIIFTMDRTQWAKSRMPGWHAAKGIYKGFHMVGDWLNMGAGQSITPISLKAGHFWGRRVLHWRGDWYYMSCHFLQPWLMKHRLSTLLKNLRQFASRKIQTRLLCGCFTGLFYAAVLQRRLFSGRFFPEREVKRQLS